MHWERGAVFVKTNRRTKALLYFKRLWNSLSASCSVSLYACVCLNPSSKERHKREHASGSLSRQSRELRNPLHNLEGPQSDLF